MTKQICVAAGGGPLPQLPSWHVASVLDLDAESNQTPAQHLSRRIQQRESARFAENGVGVEHVEYFYLGLEIEPRLLDAPRQVHVHLIQTVEVQAAGLVETDQSRRDR